MSHNYWEHAINPATCIGTKARRRRDWWIFWRRIRICRAEPFVCPAAARDTTFANLRKPDLQHLVSTSHRAPSNSPQEKTKAAGLTTQFQLADFLRDDPPQLFDWIFEHTLFCAIEPEERNEYVRAVQRWLKPDGQYLAVNYMIVEDAEGPPFPVKRDELWQRFSPHLELVSDWFRVPIPTAPDVNECSGGGGKFLNKTPLEGVKVAVSFQRYA